MADAGGTALDEARFVMGSLWPEHPATLTVWPLAFHLAVQATAHASALAPFMENDGADRICAQAVVDCIHETKEGIRLVMAELGEPDTDHVGAYDELQALVTGRVAGAD